MKRIICIILVVTLACLTLAVASSEQYYYNTDTHQFCYTINPDGTATIVGIGFKEDVGFSIPSTVDGHTVVSIVGTPKANSWPTSYNSVFISSKPNENSSDAGYYYYAPQRGFMSVPDTVHTIGNGAFYDAVDVVIVGYLSKNIRTIGDYAFGNPGGNWERFSQADITWSNIEYIGNSAFYDCGCLENLTELNNLKHLGDYAFALCSELKSIKLPVTMEYIGKNPFRGCNALTMIEVSNDNELLAFIDGALYEKPTKKLVCALPRLMAEEFSILEGITTIGDEAFANCFNVHSINIPDSVRSIREYAFFDTNVSEITIPATVSYIGPRAFPDDCVLRVTNGSYAHTYAIENHYAYQFVASESDLSWLY